MNAQTYGRLVMRAKNDEDLQPTPDLDGVGWLTMGTAAEVITNVNEPNPIGYRYDYDTGAYSPEPVHRWKFLHPNGHVETFDAIHTGRHRVR